uniref:Thioredoxin family protein n=1 Tax=Anaerolinea thermolimosa TaxID=229919 RepID=A0A7C4PIQ4_9CHLR
MNVKILGSGCASCKSMYNDVTRIVARNGWEVEVEYIQDLEKILAYGVMATPVLVVDEKVAMLGRRGSSKIERVLREAIKMQIS